MKSHQIARWAFLLLLFTSLACTSVKTPQAPSNDTNPPKVPLPASGTLGTIERLDPALDALLAKDAYVEILANGADWAEGPVFSAADKYIAFSDVKQNTVYQWSPSKGLRILLKPSGYTGTIPRGGEPGSNGLTRDHQGRLVLCEDGDRRIARLEADGKTRTLLVDGYEGKRFNSPNDLVYDSKGNLYFTDPAYGLEGKLDDPKKELPFQGVFRLSADGNLTLLTKDLKFPNGIAFSPDEKTLYIAVSDPDKPMVYAYDVKDDGSIANQRVFFDATALVVKKLKGLPDGLKIDVKGNMWLGGPGGLLIISPGGKHLGTLATGVATANCAWGDDGSTLYITADSYLCRIKTKTKGKIPGAP
jgi:gluconolactonase